MPPGIEGGLPGAQVGPRRLPPKVALQGAVEALVLAQRLGVVGPAVADGDAQAAQPDGERGVGMRRSLAPGTAIVDQEAVGQPVALEGCHQVGAHGRGALVGTGGQAEGVARVVVEDGAGMAAPGAAGPAGFEVHLPQSVGVRVLKALEGARLAGPLRRIQGVVPPQDRGNRRGCGQRLDPLAGQQHPQLAGAPGGVLRPQGPHRLLQGRDRPRRTAVRAPRAVLQPGGTLRGIAPQPLVAGRRRNPKPLAQGPPVGPRLPCQGHKLGPQVTHPALRKWHIPVLHNMAGGVHHVPGLHTRGRGSRATVGRAGLSVRLSATPTSAPVRSRRPDRSPTRGAPTPTP